MLKRPVRLENFVRKAEPAAPCSFFLIAGFVLRFVPCFCFYFAILFFIFIFIFLFFLFFLIFFVRKSMATVSPPRQDAISAVISFGFGPKQGFQYTCA